MPTIALVDDDRNILTSVSIALEAEGYRIMTYTDGASALDGFRTSPPDLAILDIKMPRMTREETSKYTDLLANGKARQFSLDMEAKSVITFPSGEMKLPGPGFYNVAGLAWSGRGRVQSVDVSTDGGATWAPARIESTPEPICTVRFSVPWTCRSRTISRKCRNRGSRRPS